MIYFEAVFDNERRAAVSIRRVSPGLDAYLYAVTPSKQKTVKGTVVHQGPEDFTLIAAVMDDYVKNSTTQPIR